MTHQEDCQLKLKNRSTTANRICTCQPEAPYSKSNDGVIHMAEEEVNMDWEREFVKTFYVYNLKEKTPAGAEKQAVEFIKHLREQSRQQGLREAREVLNAHDPYMEYTEDRHHIRDGFYGTKYWGNVVREELSAKLK